MPFGRSTREIDLVSGRNEGLTVIALDEARLFEIHRRLTGCAPDIFLQQGPVLPVDSDGLRQLGKEWNRVLAATEQGQGSRVSMADLVDGLWRVLRGQVSPKAPAIQRRGVIRRTLEAAERRDFMVSSVPDLSCELNISRRTIE